MDIDFKIGEIPARFSRNWFTGQAALIVAGKDVPLQSPWNPGTHFSFTLTRTWRVDLEGHELVVEKVRPLLMAGLRPHGYRELVDGYMVAERRGF